MMDEADRADLEVEALMKRAYAAAANAASRLAANGYCHWCKDPVVLEGALFCGSECRDDYDRQQVAAARAGRAG